MKALFLDRDGVINIDKGYVHRIEDFEFVAGIFEFCRRAQQHGFTLFVVTNQSGIGRGYYSEADFNRLTDWMLQVLSAEGVHIEQVYFCPHHPVAAAGEYLKECSCRKPKPGMLLQAIEQHGINPDQSLMIGDSDTDIVAAERAGVRGIKVVSGAADYPALAALVLSA